MKLQTKTSLYYFIGSIPILLIAGIIIYVIITSEVRYSNDELLRIRLAQIEKCILSRDTVSIKMIIASGEATITPIAMPVKEKNIFSDKAIYDNSEKEMAIFRSLQSTTILNNQGYSIQIFRSSLEYEELLKGLFIGFLAIMMLSTSAFFIINYYISKNLWKPFFQTLEILKRFNPTTEAQHLFPSTNIIEFKQLNESVESLTGKLTEDFKSQKQFSENASHEMQTPLAIMQSKIELLFQSNKLGEEELNNIRVLDDMIKRVSRLNKSLLLLSKIENNQYKPDENVHLNAIIQKSLLLFDEYISMKKISIKQEMADEVKLEINNDLCEILINNLMQNAVRHTTNSGEIIIALTHEALFISNSSEGDPLNQSEIFKRFSKGAESKDSIGLGLSIAQQIVKVSRMELIYDFKNNLHVFALIFK
jgi:signal transduction histidine kinase